MKYSWYIDRTGYVRCSKLNLPLSRFVLNHFTKNRVFYRDGNKLNNTKANLHTNQTNFFRDNRFFILHSDGEEYEILIDEEDIPKIKLYTWFLSKSGSDWYVRCKIKRKNVALHRYLLDYYGDKIVDHIDRETFNNRKINLRITTSTNNNLNTKISSINTSGYKGISCSNNQRSYQAILDVNGKRYCKSFSISKYGKEKALQLAIAARKEFEEKYINW